MIADLGLGVYRASGEETISQILTGPDVVIRRRELEVEGERKTEYADAIERLLADTSHAA